MTKFKKSKQKVGQLSPARRHFMDWVRTHVQFGTIENLLVQRGEPVLDLMPQVFEDVKVHAEVVNRPVTLRDEASIPQNWLNFFKKLEGMDQGMIARIDIAEGQPIKLKIKRSPKRSSWVG